SGRCGPRLVRRIVALHAPSPALRTWTSKVSRENSPTPISTLLRVTVCDVSTNSGRHSAATAGEAMARAPTKPRVVRYMGEILFAGPRQVYRADAIEAFVLVGDFDPDDAVVAGQLQQVGLSRREPQDAEATGRIREERLRLEPFVVERRQLAADQPQRLTGDGQDADGGHIAIVADDDFVTAVKRGIDTHHPVAEVISGAGAGEVEVDVLRRIGGNVRLDSSPERAAARFIAVALQAAAGDHVCLCDRVVGPQ